MAKHILKRTSIGDERDTHQVAFKYHRVNTDTKSIDSDVECTQTASIAVRQTAHMR